MSTPTPHDPFRKAVEAHRTGKLSVAQRLYQKLLGLDPAHAQAHHNLGVIDFDAGQIDRALDAFQTALRHAPGNGQFWISYVTTLVRVRRIHDARQAVADARAKGAPQTLVSRLTALLPQAAEPPRGASSDDQPQTVLRPLAELYRTHRHAQLLRAATAARGDYPDSLVLHNLIAAAHAGLGDVDAAVTCFDAALAIAPETPEIHYNKAVVLKQAGKLDAAQRSYEAELRLDPSHADAPASRPGSVDPADLSRNSQVEIALQNGRRLIVAPGNETEALARILSVVDAQ